MTPAELNEYLCCMRANHIMSAHFKSAGPSGLAHFELNVTFAPEWPEDTKPTDGGWKSPAAPAMTPSDPHDPDPLKLGTLDAPLALDDSEVTL